MAEPALTLFDRIEHRLLRLRSRLHVDRPLVIGGTGGSGTRLVATLCEALGWSMGTFLNPTSDAVPFIPFYGRWNEAWWKAGADGLRGPARLAMRRDFRRCVARHRLSMPEAGARWRTTRWGWKNPRSLYLLPFLHDYYPGLRYIQVVRDGRDMAFSNNTWPLRLDGPILLSAGEREMDEPHQAALIWNRGNLAAADYGERWMGGRYLPLSFEALCLRPRETLPRLAAFLGASDRPIEPLLRHIDPPDSIGRWQRADPALVAELTTLARDGLVRFGYLPGAPG